jgi:hypothetical protein
MASFKIKNVDETYAPIIGELPAVKRFIEIEVKVWKFIKTTFAIKINK